MQHLRKSPGAVFAGLRLEGREVGFYLNPWIATYRDLARWSLVLAQSPLEDASIYAKEMVEVIQLNQLAQIEFGANLIGIAVENRFCDGLTAAKMNILWNEFIRTRNPSEAFIVVGAICESVQLRSNISQQELVTALLYSYAVTWTLDLFNLYLGWDFKVADGKTIAHVAVQTGDDCLAVLLSRYRAAATSIPERLAANDRLGRTPLHIAVDKRSASMVETLLREGANPHKKDSSSYQTPFFQLSRIESRACLISLLNVFFAHGVDQSTEDVVGDTLLEEMMLYRNYEGMKLLLEEYQFDVNHKNKSGETLLMRAALAQDITAVRILMDHNPDLNVVSRWGGTLLMYMIMGGTSSSILDTILAEIDPAISELETTFYKINWEEVLNTIAEDELEGRVDLEVFDPSEDENCPSERGLTALHVAVALDDVVMVQWLIDQGVSIGAMIQRQGLAGGVTPLHLAKSLKINYLINFLTKRYNYIQVD